MKGEEKMVTDVAILGGGMSGLTAAIELKKNYPEKSVVIFERLEKVGKKILATGNGRCNLDNLTACEKDYNEPRFVSFALNEFSPLSNLDFWRSIGLMTVSDGEGRVYPRSNSSSSVLDALRFEAERLKIKIIYEKAEALVKEKRFKINNKYEAENVIVCMGGCSSPSQGSDGSGFELMKKLGHTVTALSPSLVQITTDTRFTKPLKGVRVKGKLTLEEGGRPVGSSEGEILFADYGLSGIAAMDLSRFLPKTRDVKKTKIFLDMASEMTEKEILSYLYQSCQRNPHLECENLLSGMLPKAVGKVIIKRCGIHPGERVKAVTEKDFENIVRNVKSFEFSVTGTKGFEFSQVTSGGVSLREIWPESMMSKKIKGLYLCGEILDVDSRCGGFNLHWAVSSARLAAQLKG